MTKLKTGKTKTSTGAETPPTFERILVAAVVGLAGEHQGKSPLHLLQLASRYWDADRKLRGAEPEKRILVATVAKMKDEGNLFAAQPSRGYYKTVPPLPHDLWMERMENFPGDKHELLLELMRTQVPRHELLKELFPASEVSRVAEMERLLLSVGGTGATTFVSSVASRLTLLRPQAERHALLSAIETGDVSKAANWLAETDFSRSVLDRLVTELKWIREEVWTGRSDYHTLDTPVPGLICRWLIDARQREISRKRAGAARRREEKEKPEGRQPEQPTKEKQRKQKKAKAAS